MSQDLELTALKLLLQRPDTKTLRPEVVLRLLERGFIERRHDLLVVTFRGRVALLERNSEPPPQSAA